MLGSVLYPSLLSEILALVALSFAHHLVRLVSKTEILALVALSFAHQPHKMVRSFAVFSVALCRGRLFQLSQFPASSQTPK